MEGGNPLKRARVDSETEVEKRYFPDDALGVVFSYMTLEELNARFIYPEPRPKSSKNDSLLKVETSERGLNRSFFVYPIQGWWARGYTIETFTTFRNWVFGEDEGKRIFTLKLNNNQKKEQLGFLKQNRFINSIDMEKRLYKTFYKAIKEKNIKKDKIVQIAVPFQIFLDKNFSKLSFPKLERVIIYDEKSKVYREYKGKQDASFYKNHIEQKTKKNAESIFGFLKKFDLKSLEVRGKNALGILYLLSLAAEQHEDRKEIPVIVANISAIERTFSMEFELDLVIKIFKPKVLKLTYYKVSEVITGQEQKDWLSVEEFSLSFENPYESSQICLGNLIQKMPNLKKFELKYIGGVNQFYGNRGTAIEEVFNDVGDILDEFTLGFSGNDLSSRLYNRLEESTFSKKVTGVVFDSDVRKELWDELKKTFKHIFPKLKTIVFQEKCSEKIGKMNITEVCFNNGGSEEIKKFVGFNWLATEINRKKEEKKTYEKKKRNFRYPQFGNQGFTVPPNVEQRAPVQERGPVYRVPEQAFIPVNFHGAVNNIVPGLYVPVLLVPLGSVQQNSSDPEHPWTQGDTVLREKAPKASVGNERSESEEEEELFREPEPEEESEGETSDEESERKEESDEEMSDKKLNEKEELKKESSVVTENCYTGHRGHGMTSHSDLEKYFKPKSPKGQNEENEQKSFSAMFGGETDEDGVQGGVPGYPRPRKKKKARIRWI